MSNKDTPAPKDPPAETLDEAASDIAIAPWVNGWLASDVLTARIAALKIAIEMRSFTKPGVTVIAEAKEFEAYILGRIVGDGDLADVIEPENEDDQA